MIFKLCFRYLWVCVGVFLGLTTISKAQVTLLQENFDYSAGDSLRNVGWYAHSAGTTNPILVGTTGLVWPGSAYRCNGVGLSASVSNTGSDENKPFLASVDTGAVYLSWMFRVDGVVDSLSSGYFLHLVEYASVSNPIYSAISTSHRGRTYVARGSDASNYRLGLTFNSATVPTTPGVDLTPLLDTGTIYLAVLKYQFVSGADNDLVSLFVFKASDSLDLEPSVPTLGPLTGSARDLAAVQGVALRQYNAQQRITVDGIYASNGWSLRSPTSSVLEAKQNSGSIRVYPNPAVGGSTRVVLESDQDNGQIQIRDLRGRIVLPQQAFQGSFLIQHLEPGIYWLQIQKQNGPSQSTRLWVP